MTHWFFSIPDIKMSNIKSMNNGISDVIINPTPTLMPIENLFSNDLDPTVIEDDTDEEMETSHGSNATIIQKF